MTDRELLELAAKACGHPISDGHYEESANGAWWVYVDGSGEPPNDSAWTEIWNPLTDDGDALRLAVKLGFINPGCWPDASRIVLNDCVDWITATRRAIVRVAAEIGKAM